MEPDEQQTCAVVLLVETTLRDRLVGAYLHGAAVLGGLRPDSDLDVLTVVQRSLDRHQRVALLSGLLDISGRRARRAPGRPVELTVVVEDEVNPWRYPPQVDFSYGEWLRTDYESGLVPAPRPDPDLAVLVTMTRARGATLHGPPPASVLPAVPAEDLMRATAAGVPDLLEDVRSDTRNVLLTLARVWATLATGVVLSKDQAADWVLSRLPVEHHSAMTAARDAYLGTVADDGEAHIGQALRLSELLSEQIRRL